MWIEERKNGATQTRKGTRLYPEMIEKYRAFRGIQSCTFTCLCRSIFPLLYPHTFFSLLYYIWNPQGDVKEHTPCVCVWHTRQYHEQNWLFLLDRVRRRVRFTGCAKYIYYILLIKTSLGVNEQRSVRNRVCVQVCVCVNTKNQRFSLWIWHINGKHTWMKPNGKKKKLSSIRKYKIMV
jgi:hypothetical protein